MNVADQGSRSRTDVCQCDHGIQQQLRTEHRPTAIDNYAAVRSTPAVLAGLLGLVAAATLAHWW